MLKYRSTAAVALCIFLAGTAHAGAYVGSKACAACHLEIYRNYMKTGMGRSVVVGADAAVATLPAPFTPFDSEFGQYFEVFRKGDSLYQSQYGVDGEGQEIFRQTFRLAYAVGAGENGFGFVVQRKDHLFEAPLTYYTESKTWGLSPGYEHRNYAFTRPVLAQCIGCHSGRPQPELNRVGAYREPPFSELAVGCENCHGPGQAHLAERQTAGTQKTGAGPAIVNPARLTGYLADNICMKCHEGGDARVVQPGVQEQDFRPGTPLDRVLAIFKVPLSSNARGPVLVEHYFGMTLSKCYRASGGKLGCATCHDPHRAVAGKEAVQYYRTKCLNCHTPASCKLSLQDRAAKSPDDDCAGCHMQRRTVATITHAALTDHFIASSPDEGYPEAALASHAVPGTDLLYLTAVPGESRPIPPVTLLQAFTSLIREGHKEFIARRDELLDRLAPGTTQPVVLAALGKRAAAEDTADGRVKAIRYLAAAVRSGSTVPEDLLLLAELYSREGRRPEAIATLEKGRELNPYFREFQDAIAAQLIASGKYREALVEIRKGLDLFPDDISLRVLEKKVRSALLDGMLSRPRRSRDARWTGGLRITELS